MEMQYDLVIIGAGTAAMVAAMRVRAAGWRVAVTDFRPYGGTCALRGCDPKKCSLVALQQSTMSIECTTKASLEMSISTGKN